MKQKQTNEKLKVWARTGVYFQVDPAVFVSDPKTAILSAINNGDFEFNGDTYMPEDQLYDLSQETANSDYPVPEDLEVDFTI